MSEIEIHPSVDFTREVDELSFCYDCKLISYTLGEIEPDNATEDYETDVVCPSCASLAYVVASDEEIEKYGSEEIHKQAQGEK